MQRPVNYVSEEEYLRLAEASVTKLEYYDGIIVDRAAQFEGMAGGSIPHARITSAIGFTLTSLLKSKKSGCDGYSSDLRIRVESANTYCYPDFTIICGRPETHSGKELSVLNPSLVVEVLSRTTADYDLGPKVSMYKTIPSLTCILLLSQDFAFVHCYNRDGKAWMYTTYSEPGSMIDLGSLEIMVSIEDLYGNPNDLLYVSRRSGA